MYGSVTPTYCNVAVANYSLWLAHLAFWDLTRQNRQHSCGDDTHLHFLLKLWPNQGNFFLMLLLF